MAQNLEEKVIIIDLDDVEINDEDFKDKEKDGVGD